MRLELVRSIEVIVNQYEHWRIPQIWVFGDRDGYESLIHELGECGESQQPQLISAVPRKSPGMCGLILPFFRQGSIAPVAKFVERIVADSNEARMQLIICGNREGLLSLSEQIRIAMESPAGPIDHVHVSTQECEWVIPSSISLNIRGTVSGWSRESLDYYYDHIVSGCPNRLPSDFGWAEITDLSSPYDIPEDYQNYWSYELWGPNRSKSRDISELE